MHFPPQTTTYLLIGLSFVLVCAPFVARAYQKRKGFLAAWAAARGWKFDPNSKPSDGAPYSHFPQFKRGQAQCALTTARNPITLSGRKLNLICGEFHYIGHFSFGRRQHLRRFSYLLVQVPAPAEHRLMIRRRRLGDRVARCFGFRLSRTESRLFNKMFYVRASSRDFVGKVLSPRMAESFLSDAPAVVTLANGYLCVSADTRHWNSAEREHWIRWAGRFLTTWPESIFENPAIPFEPAAAGANPTEGLAEEISSEPCRASSPSSSLASSSPLSSLDGSTAPELPEFDAMLSASGPTPMPGPSTPETTTDMTPSFPSLSSSSGEADALPSTPSEASSLSPLDPSPSSAAITATPPPTEKTPLHTASATLS